MNSEFCIDVQFGVVELVKKQSMRCYQVPLVYLIFRISVGNVFSLALHVVQKVVVRMDLNASISQIYGYS